MFMNVNRDDRITAGEFGGHEGGEAHAADAEHGEAVTRFGLHRVEHCASASLDTAREWAQPIEGRIAPDLHDKTRIGDGVRGEGGLLEERAVNRLATVSQERRTIRPRATPL